VSAESKPTSGQQTGTLTPSVLTRKDYTEIRLPSIDVNGRWYMREIRVWGGARIDLGRDQA
jgi:hypothetical protein